MRIDHLHLVNFRGITDAEYAFPRSLDAAPGGNGSFHVLIGPNGSGKTSILEGLAVAAGGWFQGMKTDDARPFKEADTRKIFYREGNEEPQYPVRVEARGAVAAKTIRWERFKLQEGKGKPWTSHELAQQAQLYGTRVMKGESVILPLISYYGTGRLWQEPRTDIAKRRVAPKEGLHPSEIPAGALPQYAKQFASRLAGYKLSVDPRCSPGDLINWLHLEALGAAQEGRESVTAHLVKSAITKSFPDCLGVRFHLKSGRLLLELRERGEVPFSMLSDGQRNLVALIGDLAWKAAQLNSPLGTDALAKTPGIVLIDEIDLHLHPEWQRTAVETLRSLFPEIQFIATTHSPFIVQAMREGEVITLGGQSVPQTTNLGVEAISAGLMGVEHPEVAPRYRKMVEVAKKYLLTVEEAAKASQAKRPEFETLLAESIAPYAHNPAFQAFLEMKRAAKLGAPDEPQVGA